MSARLLQCSLLTTRRPDHEYVAYRTPCHGSNFIHLLFRLIDIERTATAAITSCYFTWDDYRNIVSIFRSQILILHVSSGSKAYLGIALDSVYITLRINLPTNTMALSLSPSLSLSCFSTESISTISGDGVSVTLLTMCLALSTASATTTKDRVELFSGLSWLWLQWLVWTWLWLEEEEEEASLDGRGTGSSRRSSDIAARADTLLFPTIPTSSIYI